MKSLRTTLFPNLFLIALIFFGFLLDKTTNGYTQLILLFVTANIIAALSLNLVSGFTGQFSLGAAGFMAVGAYTASWISMNYPLLPPAYDLISYNIYIFAGGLAAALVGWFVGLPSLRLRGDYLAIITLGMSEIVRVILLNTEAVGGARGLFGIPGPSFPNEVLSNFFVLFIIAAAWLVFTIVCIWRLVRGIYGQSFLAVREDEIAAANMGIDTTTTKVMAFVFSSFFAGVSGAITAFATHYLNPSSFGFTKSVDIIIMVVLGGLGSVTGSVIAAVIVTIVPEFVLRPLQDLIGIDLRMIIYSLLLICFMILRPQGLFGTKEITHLWSKKRA